MKLFRIVILLLLVAINLTGCRKKKEAEKWKEPTDVGIAVDINRAVSADGDLVFSGGIVHLSSFSFSGERQQGDPSSFGNVFSGGLAISFHPSNPVAQLDYDIPQGTYTSIEIEFGIIKVGQSSITVDGVYTNTGGTDVPLRFEFASAETFEIFAEANDGSGTIVLDADVASSAVIRLDPVYWFDIISDNMLDNASLTNMSGTMTLLITEDINENIYDLLADRVDESSEAVFY